MSFVNGAVDKGHAARWLRARLEAGEAYSVVFDRPFLVLILLVTEYGRTPPPPDATIRRAIFKRDGGKCCITGKAGTFQDPVIVVPILPSPSGWAAGNVCLERSPILDLLMICSARTMEMLGVSFGPQDPIELVGTFALLGDHSRTGIEKVGARFVGTQARFSQSIQYVEVAKQIAPEILRPSHRILDCMESRPAWFHKEPFLSVRDPNARVSLHLAFLYIKPDSYSPVRKLPFGLFLKYGDVARSRNEFNALQTVWQHTSVPIPKPLDLAAFTNVNGDVKAYLLITTLPGVALADCEEMLTDRACAYIYFRTAERLFRAGARHPAFHARQQSGDGYL
ncbi:hypothetical protein C8Q72DRAFT_966773 [Fomitopsis betulina]|nr:hypothetical protein C8Q72DRAFT_966773 [Fomitopsis betulina]